MSLPVPAPPLRSNFSRSAERFLFWMVALLVVAKSFVLFATPLRSAGPPLQFAQDDFFYYLRAAQNFATSHRPTLDGTTLTNGFHPLYFLLLSAVSCFTRSLRSVFRFLWILDTLSALSIFLLSRALFARVASSVLATGLAVLMTSLSFSLVSDQMEVTLALPLGLLFLLLAFVPPDDITGRRAAAMGLVAALLFLARLDALLLVILYVVGMLGSCSYRRVLTPAKVGTFLLASLPLPLLYLWINHHFFGTLLPISGMAKQLRRGHAPSLLLPRSFNGTNEILAMLAIFAIVLVWALRRRLQAKELVLLLVTLVTPFIFYGIEMVVSDWPLWSWYFYPLRFAAVGMGVLFAVCLRLGDGLPWHQPSPALLRGVAWGVLVLASLKLCTAKYRVDTVMVHIAGAAEDLQKFRELHPGTYAMGDRSGMFTILGQAPVIQAEGLMMDRDYLQHIRKEDDLRSVLEAHHANYYVAFVFNHNQRAQWKDGCFHAQEPSIPGPSALRMRSLFCEPPVGQVSDPEGTYSVFRLSSR